MSRYIVEERPRPNCPRAARTRRAHGDCEAISALPTVPSDDGKGSDPHSALLGGFLLRSRIQACLLRCAPSGSLRYCRVRLGALGRAPCIQACPRRLATKPGEKCGLATPGPFGALAECDANGRDRFSACNPGDHRLSFLNHFCIIAGCAFFQRDSNRSKKAANAY
jgi:hypothetical protein